MGFLRKNLTGLQKKQENAVVVIGNSYGGLVWFLKAIGF